MIMKKALMNTAVIASSLFVLSACANVGAATDTSAYSSAKQSQTMQKHHKGAGKGPLSQLDLTATQQAQIKAIMQENRGAREATRANYKAERLQLQQQIQTLTASNTLNSSAVNQLAEQQAAKSKQQFIDRIQTQHAISKILTPEQRQKLVQLKAEGKQKGRRHSK